MLGFLQSVTALTKEHSDETPETQAEAVDALIEAGQEEGILDESNRDLIQSVVEFSEKTVREAMKPRPEIVAVPTNTTVEQFIELLRTKPFSRVPVFEGTIHNIVGIVFAQDVLQVPDTEARYRTVDTIMRRDVYFVPESKLVSDLLREMQQNNIRMAVVVDEYGGVAGLVTIEDLVEEIVGEIRDEHEKMEVVRESEHSYIVPGNMDVDRLVEMFGIRPEGKESATVAGLVSELAGRIPHRGEVVEEDGLRFEVLDATERRVERVRISVAKPTADEADIVRSRSASDGGRASRPSYRAAAERADAVLSSSAGATEILWPFTPDSSAFWAVPTPANLLSSMRWSARSWPSSAPSRRPRATASWELSTCPSRRAGPAARSCSSIRRAFIGPTLRSAAK